MSASASLPACASWSAPDRPTRTSIRCASSATAAAARWASRSPRRAARRGAEVVLVAGPVHLPTPAGVQRVDVRSAAQMHDGGARGAAGRRLHRRRGGRRLHARAAPRRARSRRGRQDTLTLELVRTPRHPGRGRRAMRSGRALVVGFAAETDDVERYARGKLETQAPRPDRRQPRRRGRQRLRERRQRADPSTGRRMASATRSARAPKTRAAPDAHCSRT